MALGRNQGDTRARPEELEDRTGELPAGCDGRVIWSRGTKTIQWLCGEHLEPERARAAPPPHSVLHQGRQARFSGRRPSLGSGGGFSSSGPPEGRRGDGAGLPPGVSLSTCAPSYAGYGGLRTIRPSPPPRVWRSPVKATGHGLSRGVRRQAAPPTVQFASAANWFVHVWNEAQVRRPLPPISKISCLQAQAAPAPPPTALRSEFLSRRWGQPAGVARSLPQPLTQPPLRSTGRSRQFMRAEPAPGPSPSARRFQGSPGGGCALVGQELGVGEGGETATGRAVSPGVMDMLWSQKCWCPQPPGYARVCALNG